MSNTTLNTVTELKIALTSREHMAEYIFYRTPEEIIRDIKEYVQEVEDLLAAQANQR